MPATFAAIAVIEVESAVKYAYKWSERVKTDPLASFAWKTADNCDHGYYYYW